VRINPDAISAYQTQSIRPTDSARDSAGNMRTRPKEAAGKATELNGAKFLDMLSRNERQFLAEHFRAESVDYRRKSGDKSHGSRGRLLDVKA
jgi:hypothetical protein